MILKHKLQPTTSVCPKKHEQFDFKVLIPDPTRESQWHSNQEHPAPPCGPCTSNNGNKAPNLRQTISFHCPSAKTSNKRLPPFWFFSFGNISVTDHIYGYSLRSKDYCHERIVPAQKPLTIFGITVSYIIYSIRPSASSHTSITVPGVQSDKKKRNDFNRTSLAK